MELRLKVDLLKEFLQRVVPTLDENMKYSVDEEFNEVTEEKKK